MMTRITLAVALLFCCAITPSSAQQTITFTSYKPLGYCQLSSLSSAVGLASCPNGVPVGAAFALVVDETDNTRWRDDGTAPTNSAGMLLQANGQLSYQGDLTKIQFIQTAGSPVLDISFYQVRQ